MPDWLVSFHGGHSGEFCNHAEGTLAEVVAAAVRRGMPAFGVSEHMPPETDAERYADEVEAGLTAAQMQARFRRYATEVFPALEAEYAGQIDLVLGMEIEAVPDPGYAEAVDRWREEAGLAYVVGSVHHIDGDCFDMSPEGYGQIADRCGGLDAMYLRYYQLQAQMLDRVRPEVVGHLDLIRKFAPPDHAPSPEVRRAAADNLDRIAAYGGVIEVNARAFGRWDEPYPSAALLAIARRRGVAATLGDDSHGPDQVAKNLDRCRQFLLEAGYEQIACWRTKDGTLERQDVALR